MFVSFVFFVDNYSAGKKMGHLAMAQNRRRV
jgi:hypothetical protein